MEVTDLLLFLVDCLRCLLDLLVGITRKKTIENLPGIIPSWCLEAPGYIQPVSRAWSIGCRSFHLLSRTPEDGEDRCQRWGDTGRNQIGVSLLAKLRLRWRRRCSRYPLFAKSRVELRRDTMMPQLIVTLSCTLQVARPPYGTLEMPGRACYPARKLR